MTQKDKQLLLIDLCRRLPYGLMFQSYHNECGIEGKGTFDFKVENDVTLSILRHWCNTDNNKPYLRTMSSMTKEEKKEYESFFSIGEYSCGGTLYGEEYEYIADSPEDISQSVSLFDWLDAHHFDYRGLIEKGLALKAPKGMY